MSATGSVQSTVSPDSAGSTAAQVDAEQSRAVAEAAREQEWRKPSFARGVYLGRFDLSLIHPHPRPEPGARERGERFLADLEAYLRTVDGAAIEREARIPDEVFQGLADLGCLGMKIPVEYGGLGLGQYSYNRALTMVGTVNASIAALLSAHQSVGLPEPLKLAGTEEQKRRYLPRCATGAISAFLLTEPEVGSDPARLRATAVPSADGTEYVLDGMKLWTTNGVVAELLVVMARVRKPARSEPAPGSLNSWHHTSSPRNSAGRYRRFCSSVPASFSGSGSPTD